MANLDGIRRALGASRMVRSFEMVRMDTSRAILGTAVMLLLGKAAVLWPALRAASIPPSLVLRAA